LDSLVTCIGFIGKITPTQGQEKASPGKDAQALVATFTYNNGSKQSVYFYNARLLAPNTAFYQGIYFS
jgi:hypothetical protein